MTMRYLSICSGIEAATVAWHSLGWSPVGFAEIETFPSAVLAHHYGSNMPGEPLSQNGVPNHGDFTALIDNPPDCDLLVGGTPCQAFSIAGQRRSLEDERGNLTLQFVRLAHAIRSLRWIVWENVPGVLSTEDNAFGCFLGGLVGADDALIPCEPPPRGKSNAYWRWRDGGRWPVLDDDGVETGEFVERAEGHVIRWPDAGMVAGPWGRAAWRVLDAQYFGLAQRRRRVFVVASPGGGGDPAAVLFEPRGMRGDFAACGEARESLAGDAGRGTDGGRVAGTVSSKWAKGSGGPAGDECYNLVADIAPTLRAGGNLSGGHRPPGTDLDTCESLDVAHTLRAEGFDASEDGTGRGTPIIPVVVGSICSKSFVGGAGGRPEGAAAGHFIPVYAIQERAVSENPDAGPQGAGFRAEIAFTLEARHHVQAIAFPANLSGTQVAAAVDLAPALGAINPTAIAFSSKDHGADAGSLSPTLRAGGHASSHANAGVPPAVAGAGAVRRLTPRECERLQGFPDDYTAIQWQRKPAENCPDGPRYKALGNSMAVPVMRWIGTRIQQYEMERAA